MIGRWGSLRSNLGQQIQPRTSVRLQPVDCRLHLVSHLVVPNPNYSITSLLLSIENSDDVAGLEISVESGQ
jgi:hypothetical protein